MNSDAVFLCDLDAIPNHQAKSFTLEINQQSISLFVVRRDDKFFAYKNSCPHTGVELNWQADQFLDLSNEYIQCAVHGARFRIEDGRCVWGPCLNQSLKSLSVKIENQRLMLFGT
ncbi:MAG: Rieske (2Fe-2S) protein [Gammaproteobacteria bacterium]|nr:Rieske (2Fe-2S) protein [Gammaproteobacteria bacterium]MDH5729751.1 Rieske (2Fe-2S) protein [Gammaproteobacteria bacterium]